MEIPVHIYFIAISLVVSVVYNIQHRADALYLRIFPFYLCVTLTIESISNYMWLHNMNNITLYNYFGLFSFSFYFLMLHNIIKSQNARRVVKVVGFIYPVLFLANILFFQTFGFASITYSLGCLLVAAICIYYFYELFQLPNSVDLTREPAFWLCAGLLFFYCCTFPYFGLANLMNDFPKIVIENILVLLNLMNVLLYSLFTIAFLCRIRIRKFMS
ncbi:MAG: hypothetical protein EOO04_18800 [Chitinophagaceae bacterium]|nr:MAG: hypothetical protein EOO04_18800 [Chitinophagaceae bacterium]